MSFLGISPQRTSVTLWSSNGKIIWPEQKPDLAPLSFWGRYTCFLLLPKNIMKTEHDIVGELCFETLERMANHWIPRIPFCQERGSLSSLKDDIKIPYSYCFNNGLALIIKLSVIYKTCFCLIISSREGNLIFSIQLVNQLN